MTKSCLNSRCCAGREFLKGVAMNISTIDHETLREVVRKSRRDTWLIRHRWLALFVGLPTLFARFIMASSRLRYMFHSQVS